MSILKELPPDEALNCGRASALIPMLLVLLLAFARGLNGLNADVIWADELSSLALMGAFDPPYSPMQIMEIISMRARDHVPLYYFVGAAFAHLAGWSQFAMRYLSLLAGVAMVAALFGYARDAVDKRTALIAAFLIGNNAFVLIYFQEIRGYTLLMFFVILHSWLYQRLKHCRYHYFALLILFILSASAMLYTHVLGLVMLAALGASHILVEGRTIRTKAVLSGWSLALMLFLPYLWTMLSGAITWGETERAVSATRLVEPLVSLLTNGLGVLLIPVALRLVFQLRATGHSAVFKLLILTAILGAGLMLSSWMFDLITVSRMRYFILLWFPCMILFALGLTTLTNSRTIIFAILTIWAVAGFQFGRSEYILEYAGIAELAKAYPPLQFYTSNLQEKVDSDDFVVGFTGSLSVNSDIEFYDWSVSDYYLDAQLGIDGVFLHSNLKRYRLTEDTRNVLEAHPHILLAHDPSDVPLNYARILAVVQEVLAPCDLLVDEPTLSIRKYAHPVMGCDQESASIQYDNGVRLIDRATKLEPQAQRIQVLTWWEVPHEEMLDQYNISLQIITSDGQNVRQIDRHLYNNIVPWNVIELSTADLSAGDYRLMLILYHRDTGGKVDGVDEINGESAGILPILSFSIDM